MRVSACAPSILTVQATLQGNGEEYDGVQGSEG